MQSTEIFLVVIHLRNKDHHSHQNFFMQDKDPHARDLYFGAKKIVVKAEKSTYH